jgi:NTE family protein
MKSSTPPKSTVSKSLAAIPSPPGSRSPRRADITNARRALVLQGGGALGAYQAGVYAGVSERRKDVDWVAGVSIGAVNAALIAGNPPEHRVARLQDFWHLVSSGLGQRLPVWSGDRAWLNQWSANSAAMFGIPGFFEPRRTPALLLGAAAPLLSYYDTTPLKATLERLVDFDRINHRKMRFSVGAVNVRTGNSIYFDNTVQRIGPEHIMASGALPPGFAPVHIDGEDYWDGGIVSNTPLQYVLDMHPRSQALLVLQVDLFSAHGAMPGTLAETLERQKDITYSSRTRMNTDAMASNMNLQQALADLISKLPPALRKDPSVIDVCRQLSHQPIEIVHLIYRNKPYELDSKDYEFSRVSVEEHWDAGLRDIRNTLDHPEMLKQASQINGVSTFDLTEPNAHRIRHPMQLPAVPVKE